MNGTVRHSMVGYCTFRDVCYNIVGSVVGIWASLLVNREICNKQK